MLEFILSTTSADWSKNFNDSLTHIVFTYSSIVWMACSHRQAVKLQSGLLNTFIFLNSEHFGGYPNYFSLSYCIEIKKGKNSILKCNKNKNNEDKDKRSIQGPKLTFWLTCLLYFLPDRIIKCLLVSHIHVSLFYYVILRGQCKIC